MKKNKLNKLVDSLFENIIQLSTLNFKIIGIQCDIPEFQLKDDFTGFINTNKLHQRKNIAKFNNQFYWERKVFEFMVFENLSLFLLLNEIFDDDKKELFGLNENEWIRINNVTLLLNNQINILNSILLLLERGLTQPSDILFRNYIELVEKSVAILSSNDFSNNYLKEAESKKEEEKIWHQTKPSIAFKIVKERINEFYPNEFGEAFFNIRDLIYSKTSKAVHGERGSTAIEAFVVDNKTDNLGTSILGKISTRLNNNFKNYITYSHIVSRLLIIILINDFKLNLSKFGENGIYHGQIFEISNELFKTHFEVFKNKNSNYSDS